MTSHMRLEIFLDSNFTSLPLPEFALLTHSKIKPEISAFYSTQTPCHKWLLT